MIICAIGMWRLRYWAVLGFQAVLAIVILIFALLLIRASNLLGFVVAGRDHRRRRLAVLQARAGAQPDADAGPPGSLRPSARALDRGGGRGLESFG